MASDGHVENAAYELKGQPRMDRFDLARLTDFDFERVCKDIFESHLRVNLEIFAPGPDLGIDLRHFAPNGERVVIQCKHWHTSGRSALVRHMRRSESSKVTALAPERYLLATSVDLTARSKEAIKKALAPYVLTPGDLWGAGEIEGALLANEDIVRRHIRLWMSSAAVLQTILNKEILLRSANLVADIQETLLRFAPSTSFSVAAQILERHKVCVISGIPGIGKTTLAQVLAAQYVANGYELIEISRDIEEALRVWDDRQLQVFYYDDFLGQTSLRDTVSTNEDSRLIRFIKQVERAGNKAFILTTREYILAQAKQASERLNTPALSVNQYLLDLGSYSNVARAEVLYNHLYFSKLPSANRAAFADPAIYSPIIQHRNFNPRLIALTLDAPSTLTELPEHTVQRISRNLDDPSALWDHMFQYQLTPDEINVVEVIFLSTMALELAELTTLWRTYSRLSHGPQDGTQLRRVLAGLEGTLVRMDAQDGKTLVRLHNPSVRDYMRSRMAAFPEVLENALNGISTIEQLEALWITATGHDGHAIVSLVLDHAIEVEQLFLGILDPSRAPGWPDWAARVALHIEMADRLGSAKIAAVVTDVLLNRRPDYIEDPSAYVELFAGIRDSRHPAIEETESALLEWFIDEITQDLSDWGWTQTIGEVLRAIGGDRAKGETNRIEERLDDMAIRAAERLAYGGQTYASEAEAVEMLDRLSAFDQPAESFEGYSQLAQSVEASRRERDAQARRTPNSSTHHVDEEAGIADDVVIAAMMGCLTAGMPDDGPA